MPISEMDELLYVPFSVIVTGTYQAGPLPVIHE